MIYMDEQCRKWYFLSLNTTSGELNVETNSLAFSHIVQPVGGGWGGGGAIVTHCNPQSWNKLEHHIYSAHAHLCQWEKRRIWSLLQKFDDSALSARKSVFDFLLLICILLYHCFLPPSHKHKVYGRTGALLTYLSVSDRVFLSVHRLVCLLFVYGRW